MKKGKERKYINRGVGLAILASFTFSLMNVLVKTISGEIPSHEIAFFRGLIGTVLLAFLMKKKGVKLSKQNRPLLLLRGFLGGMYVIVYFFAISTMKLGDVSILVHMSGFFVILFSSWFLNETLSLKAWPFAILIFLGAFVIINPFSYSTYSVYALFGILSAILSALSAVTIRKLARSGTHHPYEIVFYFLAVTTVVALGFTFKNFVMPDAQTWGLLFLLGAVSLGAQVFLTGAFGNANAIVVEVVRYIGIFFNGMWGVLLFGESLGIRSLVGAALIVGASVMLTRQKT